MYYVILNDYKDCVEIYDNRTFKNSEFFINKSMLKEYKSIIDDLFQKRLNYLLEKHQHNEKKIMRIINGMDKLYSFVLNDYIKQLPLIYVKELSRELNKVKQSKILRFKDKQKVQLFISIFQENSPNTKIIDNTSIGEFIETSEKPYIMEFQNIHEFINYLNAKETIKSIKITDNFVLLNSRVKFYFILENLPKITITKIKGNWNL